MAGITLDLTNYKDRFGSRVPEGQYLVQIEDIEVGQTKKGDPMMTVYLRIVGGDHDGSNIVDRLTINDRAMFRVVGFLSALGVKTPRKRIQIDPQRLIGRKVGVEVRDGEPYNGNVRSEVGSYVRIARKSEAETADIDDVSDDPTDYDEDVEPQKVQAAEEKRSAQAAPADTADDLDIDLDDVEL